MLYRKTEAVNLHLWDCFFGTGESQIWVTGAGTLAEIYSCFTHVTEIQMHYNTNTISLNRSFFHFHKHFLFYDHQWLQPTKGLKCLQKSNNQSGFVSDIKKCKAVKLDSVKHFLVESGIPDTYHYALVNSEKEVSVVNALETSPGQEDCLCGLAFNKQRYWPLKTAQRVGETIRVDWYLYKSLYLQYKASLTKTSLQCLFLQAQYRALQKQLDLGTKLCH